MKCRNFGKENKLLLFDILDYIVDQGSMNIWKSVSSKKFFSFLLDILKTQNDAEIQTKLLQLIQNWGNSFQNKKDVVPNFYKIYNKFRMNGVVFPPKEQPNYYNFISKNNPGPPSYKKEKFEESKDIKDNFDEEEENEENNSNNKTNNDFEYIESIKDKLKISNFESKYRRLVAFLVNMHNNIKTANQFIDRKEISKLKDPINTIKKGNKTLMDTISSGRLKDEKLMDITLATTEDINQTLEREEELKAGNKPNKFTSYFILNEVIPIKNKGRMRAKSERKKGVLNKRSTYEKPNKNEKNITNTNIQNVNDIFDLFSNSNTNTNSNISSNITNNNNQNNNMISNYFTNQNTSNNKFFDINPIDDMQNFNNNNNDFNNYNNNNENKMNQMDNLNNNFNRNNFNRNNPKNKMIDLFQDNQNNNPQNNNFQNQNFNKQDEFDMYGPAPEINSNELVNYIGNFNNNNNNNNNNNQFQNNNLNNNNFNYGMNPNSNNNGNNFGNDMGSNYQMTQEEIEREKRLKELDELF